MKEIIGQVVSTKMQKTLVVEVEIQRLHPLYKKYIRIKRRYKAHNENPDIKLGDTVKITTVKPISKDKHFKVVGKISL